MDDIDAGRALLESKAASFTTNETPESLKQMDSAFWKFSEWLVKNKTNLSHAAVSGKLEPIPNPTRINKIWDNLFYDIIVKRDPNVRETCLQYIIAINFAQKFANYSSAATTDPEILMKEAKDLERLANGKVILHQSFTKAKDTNYSPSSYKAAFDYTRHEALHEARIAALKAEELKGMKKDFEGLHKTYERDFRTAFDTKMVSYKAKVKTDVDRYLTQNPNASQQAKFAVNREVKFIKSMKGSSSEVTKSVADFETNLSRILPPGTVEEFDFTFEEPLSRNFMQGKVGKSAQDYVTDKNLENENVVTAIKTLEKEIKRYKSKANIVFRRRPKEMLVNGIPVKANGLSLKDISMSFYQQEDGTHAVYFSLETGVGNAFIQMANLTLKIGANTYTTTEVNMRSNVSNCIFASLFESANIMILPASGMVSLSGTIELNNEQLYTFDLDAPITTKVISGSAVPTKTNISNPDLHFGVNKIGVADYRRVEQELCAYIPGEVAHIENVMAREYKERTTRKMTRSVTSTSIETEKEKEESLDASSTSRNEMSTEVASVLDKDKSIGLGFNASTSGEIGKVTASAGVSGDFSSGKSSSDSNSVARTMAEDVTRRALERITQKTAIKRTSKLIQEIEEKNSHGMDNRAGDKHVTGVYRWIDKLYKNRVVNYGKRLMYEFMVPEPARFYKEALIIKAEERMATPNSRSSNEDTILIPPTNPFDIGMYNANSVDRYKCEKFGAEYGIEVTAPPERYVNQSVSFGEGIGKGDDFHSFTYETLQIQTDYECYSVKGEISCSYEADTGREAFIKCSLGGRSVCHHSFTGKQSNHVMSIGFNLHDIEGGLPLVVNCQKMTAFAGSIIAKNQLKTSVYQEWQQTVYKEVMDAYTSQLEAYEQAEKLAKEEQERKEALKKQEAESNKKPDQKLATNSAFNQQRMQTELKRLCIEMLTKPFGFVMGKDFYQNGKHDIPEVRLGSTLDTYSSYVTFFEQAFDWQIMSERFYPYYWADRSDWKTLFQTQDGGDYSFQAFLQSGMGRVIVPVRQGFEDAVAYFMETGEVWGGSGLVVDTKDKLYLSIVDETTNIEGVIEGQEWETIVPTTLKVIQQSSVALWEEGLPKCEGISTTLGRDGNTLNSNSTPTP